MITCVSVTGAVTSVSNVPVRNSSLTRRIVSRGVANTMMYAIASNSGRSVAGCPGRNIAWKNQMPDASRNSAPIT